MEYNIPGDPILIKNIVSKFKSQGIFDQIRKECIADVDTKPAYQNLCHRADNQVSKFLSRVKWGPDLHKNQTRENIRRQINECSFVEPGIAIIVDQLVNPRINTEIVPKVEDMLYKFLGIPTDNIPSSQTEAKYDKNSSKDLPDCEVPGISSREIYDKRKDSEKSYIDRFEEHYRMDNQKNNGISTSKNDSSTNKIQSSGDKYYRDKSSNTKIDPFDALLRDSNKSIKTEPEKPQPRTEFKRSPLSEFDSESSDDEMSPPFEPHVKSDNDMSIGSGDSNFSEIIDTRPPNEPEIPGVDDQIDDLCKIDDSKIITEHEDSLDSVQSAYSTAPEPEPEPMSVPAPAPVSEPEPEIVPTPVSEPEQEKVHISPIDIPKTPTINYETSDDSDDYVKNKKLQENVTVDAVEPLEVPEVNFDKIVEKVIEDNTNSKALEMVEFKPSKEEDKHKDKNRSDDAKKKIPSKHKDDKSVKPVENKEKHAEKKSDYRSDKDRKYDKHRSEGRSKDREKEKPKHDSSKIHNRKDDKSHHSRDHSKSDYDRKSKSEHKKDDYKLNDKKDSGRSDHKKDDRGDHKKEDKSDHRKDPRGDRKKEDDKKHSRDDKDRKRDPHKSSSSDDKKSSKPRVEESKHKYPDKPRDDKKSSKNGDHHKSKKKSEDPKKSRSHCNLDEKKKTDRRSSDRDSSGPSTSNSSSVHHTSSQHSSKSDKDKGSSKHRHSSSSSSSSHKTKRNDSEADKSRSEKQPNDQEKNHVAEDDLEMILESSPDKGFQNNIKPEVNFSARKILVDTATESNDHIEDMMNEMFQPTKPVLKKPKIAKNFADIRRIMKLRKLYEENINESITDMDKSTMYKIKLRNTVDYFVMRRFGKNGNDIDECKELTNAIIETLTDVKLNITRVDRRYSLVDGSCTLISDENCLTVANNVDDGKNNTDTKTNDNEDIENMPIIEDERANLILEDLANSYTDPNFKLGNLPTLSDDPPVDKLPQSEENTLKIVQSEIKANGAKTRLPVKLAPSENNDKSQLIDEPSTKTKSEEDDSSPGLKLKIKSISDGKNITWQACDQADQIQDPVHYLPLPEYNSGFMQYVNGLLNEEYNFEVQNLSIEIDYPECYDYVFTNFLGAKVLRPKPDDPKTSPIKYNSQIINKKVGDKSIMLRIKKSSESEEFSNTAVVDQKILNKKRKLADDSGVELDTIELGKDEAQLVKKRKKTLGIKRSFVNPLKVKLISGQFNDTQGNDNLIGNVINEAKNKNSPVPKKMAKLNKTKEMAAANANHKKSESESSDGRRSSVSSSGTSSTHSKGINESAPVPPSSPAAASTSVSAPVPSKSKKNTALNGSKKDTIENNAVEGPTTTTKMTDPPPSKKPIDTKSAEEKRKQTIMKSYYDESDLYKPRPSLRLTSRRYRLGNTENT